MLVSGSRVSRLRHCSRVAVPQLSAGDHAAMRAAGDPGHDTPSREILPDHQTRAIGKDLPDDGGVIAVDHPRRLGRGEAYLGPEHVRVRGSPTGSVVEPVELDVRNAQIGCEPRREGGLARTCIAGDQHPGRHAHAENRTGSYRGGSRRAAAVGPGSRAPVAGMVARLPRWLGRPAGCAADAR